jgi:hypothetical protein
VDYSCLVFPGIQRDHDFESQANNLKAVKILEAQPESSK